MKFEQLLVILVVKVLLICAWTKHRGRCESIDHGSIVEFNFFSF